MDDSLEGIVVDEKLALEFSGENRLENIQELALRDVNLIGFDTACVSKLHFLSVLSLSNNNFSRLVPSHWSALCNLKHLNLNFNHVSSIEPLRACICLESIHLSNNLVSDPTPLGCLVKLKTLCLYKNRLADLACCFATFDNLKDLSELMLDGNPCARVDDYREKILRWDAVRPRGSFFGSSMEISYLMPSA